MRIASAFVFLSLIVFTVLTDHVEVTTLGTLVGALLITMGFEVGLRNVSSGMLDGTDEQSEQPKEDA